MKKSGNATTTDLLNIKNKYTNTGNTRTDKKMSLEFDRLSQGFFDKPKRQSSDLSTKIALNKKSIDGTLTQADVDAVKDQLTDADVISFSTESYKILTGDDDKVGKTADQLWVSEVEAAFPRKEQKLQKEQFINSALLRLSDNNIKGMERQITVREWLKKEIELQGSTGGYLINADIERRAAVDSWGNEGVKIIGLIENGLASSGQYKSISGSTVNKESTKIAKILDIAKENNDSSYQELVNYYLREGIPFTYATLVAERDRLVYKKTGAYTPTPVF